MSRGNCLGVLLALLFLAVSARASEMPVVLYPPDLMLSAEAKIPLFAFRPKGSPPVPVTVNGRSAGALDGKRFLSGEAVLAPGENVLRIGGRVLRVYFLAGSDAETFRPPGKGGKEPAMFRTYRLHPALQEGCEVCHTDGSGRGKPAVKDLKEACYGCHDDFGEEEEGKRKYVHAPVEEGECTACHDPHFSSRPRLQKADNVCLECHDAFSDEETVHYPVKEGKCIACHSPHAGVAPKQLVRPGNALCLGCHESPHAHHRSAKETGDMIRVPAGFPTEKGSLSCLGCHFPHQSAERRLFRMPQGDLCRTCHPM